MQNIVAVVGSGYVGLTTAAVLASSGYTVRAVDIDADKVATINSGTSHFYEPGLGNLISHGVENGTLTATTSYQKGLADTSVVFSCVGTPDNPDGSPNLDFIYRAAESIAENAPNGTVLVQKSTVPVGTGEEVQAYLGENYPDFDYSYISNPEFLREGSAIADTLVADRIVLGGGDSGSVERVNDLYGHIDEQRGQVAERAEVEINTPAEYSQRVIKTSLESAELIKISANAFLALKISFANSIGKLADEAGADVTEVMEAVGRDERIGRAFLNAGRGYGGGCFPKDVSGLINSAQQRGVDLDVMSAAEEVNDSMPGYIVNRAKQKLDGLAGKKVAVLGLSFKPDTSDVRKSPGVAMCNLLERTGAAVKAYDPRANDEARGNLCQTVTLCGSAREAAVDAEAVFIATHWAEFMDETFLPGLELAHNTLLVDCMNAFRSQEVRGHGLEYLGVGRGSSLD
jgi:UDPglucose 6-dehydrogenase